MNHSAGLSRFLLLGVAECRQHRRLSARHRDAYSLPVLVRRPLMRTARPVISKEGAYWQYPEGRDRCHSALYSKMRRGSDGGITARGLSAFTGIERHCRT